MSIVPPDFTWGELVTVVISAVVGWFARIFTSRK